MESVKYVGLDDNGRQIILTRVFNEVQTSLFEMVGLLNRETGVLEVLRTREVTDPYTIMMCSAEMTAASTASNLTTITGRMRGLGKSQLFDQMYSKGLAKISADSITVFDDVEKPVVKMGLFCKQTKDQGHVNRKPQPNKGPLGKRDWQ